jgi:hypothetical protein
MTDLTSILRSDLAPFADPATELRITGSGDKQRFVLTRGGKETRGIARLRGDDVEYDFENHAFSSLTQLLASNAFANIEDFAHTQTRVLATRRTRWIDQELRRPGAAPITLLDLLATIRASDPRQLQVVVVDGPAGVGKTHLLERICLEQARAFLERQSAVPMLYVGSRGRKLSRLNDAIAASIQDIRGRFVYTELHALIRNGVLGIAIDGFDELANEQGYAEAWDTFRDFVDELGGRGLVMLAARDSFFDAERFEEKIQATQKAGSVKVHQVQLRGPSWEHARAFLEQEGVSTADITRLRSAIDPARRPYVIRPVFLSKLPANAGEILEGSRTFRTVLVEAFLERETKIVVGAAQKMADPVMIRAALEGVFREVALEMHEQERDWIDIDLLCFFVEEKLGTVGQLSRDDVLRFVQRASSLGFMEVARGTRARQFPHDEVRYFFLSDVVIQQLGRSEERLQSFLERGNLDLDFCDVFAERVDGIAEAQSEVVVENLIRLASLQAANTALTANATAVLTSLLRVRPFANLAMVQGLTTGSASLSEARFAGVLRNCQFTYLDVRGADLRSVRFEDVHVHALAIDDETRFGSMGPRVTVLVITAASGENKVYGRSEIDSEIAKRSELPPRTNALGELLIDFCRWSRRQFFLAVGDSRMPFADPNWKHLKAILERHGRLTIEVRDAGGPRVQLARFKDPESMMSRRHRDPTQQADIDRLWTEILSMPND